MPLSRRALLAGSVSALAVGRASSLPPVPAPPLQPQDPSPRPTLPTPAAAEPACPRWRPKKAVKIGMVQTDGSLVDKFKLLRDCGFDGVEVDSPGDLDVAAARSAADRCELLIHGVVNSVHWSQPLSDGDPKVRAAGRAGLEQALRDAKALGASSVLLVPAVVKQDVSYQDAWVRSQAEIRKVLPLASELGIDLLIENVWNKFLLGPMELARYLDELEHPRMGSYFDPGNLVQFGWPEHWVPILAHRIKKVDVKDYKRGRLGFEGFDVGLNDGEANWPRVIAALRSVGYDGWFTAEMRGGDGKYLADLGRRMDQFLKG